RRNGSSEGIRGSPPDARRQCGSSEGDGKHASGYPNLELHSIIVRRVRTPRSIPALAKEPSPYAGGGGGNRTARRATRPIGVQATIPTVQTMLSLVISPAATPCASWPTV